MSLEEQLRRDLHRSPLLPRLLPEPDLAESVLRELRRRRERRVLVAVAAAVAAVVGAVAVPWGLSQHRADGRQDPAGPNFAYPVAEFPTHGGGPQVIHSYTTEINASPHVVSYLLDEQTGEYREFPYERLVLSPDRRTVAFEAHGRIGLAERKELLVRGESAAQWLSLAAGTGLSWSPDGTALLVIGLSKGEGTAAVVAQRYDLATGTVTSTPITVDVLGTTVGWAADSRGYLVLLRGGQGGDTVRPGGLRYVGADGTPGETIAIEGGEIGGADAYSPSREYLLVDASRLMTERPVSSKVVDVKTGEVILELPGGRAGTVGWYDDRTVVTVRDDPAGGNYGVLELVDIDTGDVIRRLELTGVPYRYTTPSIQIGPSDRLVGAAEAYGF